MSERYEYARASLKLEELNPSPVVQLEQWISEAIAERVIEPKAACLSTVSEDGQPSSRMVLIRSVEASGISFFTNYMSRKGIEMRSNPKCCLNMWWGDLERQVRIEGEVEPMSDGLSDAYWRERPRDSQLASAASPQSQPISDRNILLDKVRELAEHYPDEVPRPEHWGGYNVIPGYFEFWQGGISRLHDRFAYRLEDRGWVITRLAP